MQRRTAMGSNSEFLLWFGLSITIEVYVVAFARLGERLSFSVGTWAFCAFVAAFAVVQSLAARRRTLAIYERSGGRGCVL